MTSENPQVGLFNWRSTTAHSSPPDATPPGSNPLLQIDRDKRYDVYCTSAGEERVTEDVRFVGTVTG
jgi:hypothetical protein